MMKNIIVIYHGKCADGFTAAYIAHKYFEMYYPKEEYSVEFHGAAYQKDPPDVKGKDVYILDFSYKRPVMEKIIEEADKVTILDHHKSAIEDLKGLPGFSTYSRLDSNYSGAMLAWMYFNNPADPVPPIVEYVQDRDLWKFELDDSREVAQAIFSYEYTFENWDALFAMSIEKLVYEGQVLLRKHKKDIDEYLWSARDMRIGGHVVPVINVPYFMGSDSCHELAKGKPFSGYYFDKPEGRFFGLRSAEDGEDVSVIASQYGGGGHKHASGFTISRKEALEFEIDE